MRYDTTNAILRSQARSGRRSAIGLGSAGALALLIGACGTPGAEIEGSAPSAQGTSEAASHHAPASGSPLGASGRGVQGDIDGDGRSDIALEGGIGWNTLPVAFSNGDGTFNVTNKNIVPFNISSTQTGARMVTGDFNGDGKMDVALTGGIGWNTVMVAFSNGDGSFRITNLNAGIFPRYAEQPGAHPMAGDFNGDGKTDIALIGGIGWNSVPVALSNGDGTFSVTNKGVANFPGWSYWPGARAVEGDFNGDGKGDIALVGGTGWSSVPIAFSNGDGTFSVTNRSASFIASASAQPGAVPVAGDFNGDGKGDIALTGGIGWNTVAVAFSNGDGTFNVTNVSAGFVATVAAQPGAKPVAGDFNGDGRGDIALVGGVGWNTVPVAFSNGDGSFRVTNSGVPLIPIAATQPGAQPAGAYSNSFDNSLIWTTGYVSLDGGVPVGGLSGLAVYPDGTYAFTGMFHDTGVWCYNYELAWALRSASGNVFTFNRSASLGGGPCGGASADNWSLTGNNAALAASWGDLAPELLAGRGWHWKVNASLDTGSLWAEIVKDLGYVATVIKVVGAVLG